MGTHHDGEKVRIHIDGRALEVSSPTSGEILYTEARVPEGEVLYREVTGNQEDQLVPRDEDKLHLIQDQHFYTSVPHPEEHIIIVNARRKTVIGSKVSFEYVVKLAFPGGPPTEQTVYTVAFSNGPPRNPEGKMVAGQTVKIQNGMVFDVTETSRS